MRKKNIFISICIFFNCFLFAQIPYAIKQPKWSFPVYAEDATGKKDTIYLGYNPGAINSPDSDVLYGEIWHKGVNDFSLYTYAWSAPTDSVIKTEIRDTANYGNSLPYSVLFSNVVLPVRFKWDVSLLRSDSIPFLNQNPLPNAQIAIGMPVGSYLVDDPNVTCDFSKPIIISDTINTNMCNCYAKDSLKLLDPFGNTSPQSFFLSFSVVPWTGQQPTSVKENKRNNIFTITPNPFTNFIQIMLDSKPIEISSYTIIIYSGIGNEIINTNFTNTTTNINTVNLVNGIYCIKILSEKGELLYLKKIIKN